MIAMTYKDLKDRHNFIKKDEILRVSLFDATKMIIEGRKGIVTADPKMAQESFYKRCDAFFTDYSLMGLNIQQNYLKVMTRQIQEAKRSDDDNAELQCLKRMYKSAVTMSDFAVVEDIVRGTEQNWNLLPLCSILAVKTGHHISGKNGSFFPGYPEFAGWLGKNSTRARVKKILLELSLHMNYKISADLPEFRLHYLPVVRERFLTLLIMHKDKAQIHDAIELMDNYGLDRDDLFENLDEFCLDKDSKKFSDLDSKLKSAFTREYNKALHKSQALVHEQGFTKTKKKKTHQKMMTR